MNTTVLKHPIRTAGRHRPAGVRNQAHRRGFALVVTLTLMVLLTVVAIGLLSLSSILVRSSRNDQDMVTARANARLALVMAIGELQKSLGPDRAVTATSAIHSPDPAKPNLTGVWQSWDYDPASPPNDYASEKDDRFRRWLVSTPDPGSPAEFDFVSRQWGKESIELVGDGALGPDAPEDARVRAGLVRVADEEDHTRGAYAWHVSDESVKARVNLYRDPGKGLPLWRQRALLAGHRPDPSVIRGFNGSTLDFLPTDNSTSDYATASLTKWKLPDLGQFALLGGGSEIRPFRNDVTPYSLGVLADVRRGGLKQDLSTLFAFADTGSLPAEYSGANGTLYASTHGITCDSDPHWAALADYHNIYREIEDPDTTPTIPAGFAKGVDFGTLEAPDEFRAAPVVAKVEMLLTYVTRGSTWSTPYMGFFVFTPLITLHNPYNVNLSFQRIKVTIGTVPIGIRLRLNGRPKSSRFNPINKMYIIDNGTRDVETKYIMEIANWPSPDSSRPRRPIAMKPGQSLLCSPYLDPETSWADKGTIDNRGNRVGREAARNETLKAKPGFFGRCFGFNVDVVSPTDTPGTGPDDVCLLAGTESIGIDHKFLVSNTGVAGEFQVKTELYSAGQWLPYGGLRYKFGSNRTLQKLVGKSYYSYPIDGGEMRVMDAYVPDTEPISNHANAQTFGVFSAYARTTNGGVYETGQRTERNGALNALRDGLLAGKPFLHHNPAVPVVSLDLTRQKLGNSSHEINLQPFESPGDAEDYFAIDSNGRTPIATGNSVIRGIKSAAVFELPSGPMQAIADFRRSNALSTSFLPGFVQPVANSGVSPLMSTDQVVETNSAVADYPLLDHSVLANHALYDRFYFSTLADYDNTGIETVFSQFLNHEEPLANQALTPYLPAGRTRASAREEIFENKGEDAHRHVAEYQLVQGPFNVNSTNVEAWKATLSALADCGIVTLWAKDSSLELRQSGDIPILGMSLPNGGPADENADSSQIDNARTNEWNGYRELSEEEIESLAVEIVEQVRERGPFLSMSEFVNRRVGPDSELTRSGALHKAIELSGINERYFRESIPIIEEDLADNTLYNYTTPSVVTGNPAEGAPSWISQGDLMKVLEPRATVRSDTFVIRVMGEARDNSNKVTARAYAEAVVQRVPDYLDASDRPGALLTGGSNGALVNRKFGRRMSLVSFRWLTPAEI